MHPYRRLSETIAYLVDHYVDQPSLDQLAARAGWSPFHFQRQFTEWVGVSPKDYIQSLTLSHARALLREGRNVLETALETGLSGPGRLHDLCLGLTAATPGEIKEGGRGLSLTYGYAETPFGVCLMGQAPRGVCHVAFVGSCPDPAGEQEMRHEWPHAKWRRDDATANTCVQTMFHKPPQASRVSRLKAWVKGTPFQVRVWRALLAIPPGQVVSYGQLAAAMGQPGAARAVGQAVGANPVAWLIPCHRVLQSTGALGGYRWGPQRKRSLLAWEACP